MRINKGQDCYALPDDWDRALTIDLRMVDSCELEAIKARNPGMAGNPLFGCVIKGFDDAPFNRLFVWPRPIGDENISVTYMPVCIGKAI